VIAAAGGGGPLAALSCPRCGGEVSVREGARLGRCRRCDVALLARAPDRLLRYALRPSRDERSAADAVRSLLAGPDGNPAAASLAVFERVDTVFVPYWRFQATVIGRLRGVREVRRRVVGDDEGAVDAPPWLEPVRQDVRQEPVDKPIREIWRATLSASPADDLGVPLLTARRQRSGAMGVTRAVDGLAGLGFFDGSLFELGTVLDVMIPLEQARREAEAIFASYVATRGFDLDDREVTSMRIQPRTFLLYYPVQVVRYRVRGRSYRATLDARTGEVVQAVLPADLQGPLRAALAAAALAGLAASVPLRWLLWPSAGLEAMRVPWSSPWLWAAGIAVAGALWGGGRLAGHALRLQPDRVVER
jgi:hypothetical protein